MVVSDFKAATVASQNVNHPQGNGIQQRHSSIVRTASINDGRE